MLTSHQATSFDNDDDDSAVNEEGKRRGERHELWKRHIDHDEKCNSMEELAEDEIVRGVIERWCKECLARFSLRSNRSTDNDNAEKNCEDNGMGRGSNEKEGGFIHQGSGKSERRDC